MAAVALFTPSARAHALIGRLAGWAVLQCANWKAFKFSFPFGLVKTEHYLLIGGAVALAALIKTSNGKSLLENTAAGVGSGIGASVPTAVFSAAGAFSETSWKAGFTTGQKVNDVLKPAAQTTAENQGIQIEQAQPTLAQWEAQYQAATNPFFSFPILRDITRVWHDVLTW